MNSLWLYGRSGAGKSTLANYLEVTLDCDSVIIIDGDELRKGLCADLKFTKKDRDENHRRIAELVKLLISKHFIPIVTTIAPQHSQREIIRNILGNSVLMVHIDAPVQICSQRDPKGLYKKASRGALKDFLDFPFDTPLDSEKNFAIDTTEDISISSCKLLRYVTDSLHLG